MVNEGFWIGFEVANTPASHLRSAARAVDYLHRAFDVIPEVDATSALCEFSRMRREGHVAEQLHCSLHVKELKVTTTELERQA